MSVDVSKQSAEILGELLPSLQQMTLDDSVLYSFRDLGTSLHSLQILSVARSGITDLDGIGALTCLRELYAQHNRIADISPLCMHDELQIVGTEMRSRAQSGCRSCPHLCCIESGRFDRELRGGGRPNRAAR